MKKIIFLASYAPSLVNFRLHLMKAFLAKGFTVVAMAPADEEVSKRLAGEGILFLPVSLARNGYNPIRDLTNFIKLIKLIREQRAQFIFSYTIKPVIYGSLAAKLAGVPHIYSMITGLGYVFSKRNFLSNGIALIAKSLFRVALRTNKKVFFQNKDNAALFIQSKLIRENEKVVIVNGSGVDIQFYKQQPLPHQLSFLMIARLLYDKGVCEYVQAAKKIKAIYPHVTFKLAGWIDTNPNAIPAHQLNDWIASGVIDYLGKLADVREAIANAAVYVLPSYAEGTPRTVLEAMAMGRPIITTDVPGCKETVKPNENGLLVAVKNSEALREAMEQFILQPSLIAKMGEKSREIAVLKYDVHKVNQQMLAAML